MLAVFAIVGIAIYIYLSFAFMRISQKANISAPGLAWIPGFGPIIQAFRISGMHWWPWLLLMTGFFGIIPIVGIIIYILGIATFFVFTIIWLWKMYEAVDKPGWWSLLGLIPFIGGLIALITIGIAAWSK
jgi:hypothetical protein